MLNTIYHKIPNVWNLSHDNKSYDFDSFRSPEIKYLQNNDWIWTEKVDGTNTRIIWDGHSVRFGGRTPNSQMRPEMKTMLNELFGGEVQETKFEELFGEKNVILFGETYGGKIQAVGKQYRLDPAFRMFDVMIDGYWMPYAVMMEIAAKLNVKAVPVFMVGTIVEALNGLRSTSQTLIEGTAPIEGVVGVPAVRLMDNNHNRIIVKLKKCFLPGDDT